MTQPINILVVDDEVEVGNFFGFLLSEKGYQVVNANTGKEVSDRLAKYSFALAMVDLRLPDTDGIKVLEQIKTLQPDCRVIIMTGYSTVKTAVDAIKIGAYDYIEKPFEEIEELEMLIETALTQVGRVDSQKQSQIVQELAKSGIICSPESPFLQILALAKKMAGKNITLLIQGETGVGKEVLARYIHAQSQRASAPFIAVNCAAFTETLLESELFGHEKGAFTGAQGARKGIFQIANGGTLFLDEVGDASPAIQAKLLRVLETGEYLPVGGEKILRTDLRVIAATNVPLTEAVAAKKFREDLFYRLNVVTLEIPPLRERKCDIKPLVDHFIKKLYNREDEGNITVSTEAMERLNYYPWPGNIRELANVMARAIVLSEEGQITTEMLPEKINQQVYQTQELATLSSKDIREVVNRFSQMLVNQLIPMSIDLNELIKVLKESHYYISKKIVEEAVNKARGNRVEAAKRINSTSRVLRYYLNERDK